MKSDSVLVGLERLEAGSFSTNGAFNYLLGYVHSEINISYYYDVKRRKFGNSKLWSYDKGKWTCPILNVELSNCPPN